MNKVVVNPGTPQAWEIQLKPGVNTIGRGTSTDFQITHPEVSGTHCEITVTDGRVLLKDLGSTNGTFVNGAAIQEMRLEPGQSFCLGSVQMVLQADAPESAPVPVPPPAPQPAGAGGLRLNREVPVGEADSPPPLLPPTMSPAPPPVSAGPAVCKFHPKNPARHRCNKCNRSFCDLCVTTLTIHGEVKKRCRTCGVDCVPLQVQFEAADPKSFFSLVPGAFKYPLNGDGFILLFAGILFYLLIDSMRALAHFGGMVAFGGGGLLATFGTGYLVSYLRRIIQDSSAGETRMPDWPEFTEWSDVSGPAGQFALTVLICFSPAIGLAYYVGHNWEQAADAPVWTSLAIVPSVILGCIYFPMAFLAVAMFDSLASVNPLLVVPSIFRVALKYLVACGLLGVIVGLYFVGKFILKVIIPIPVLPMALSGFLNLYLLAVEMRVLGLLYFSSKQQLGWFDR